MSEYTPITKHVDILGCWKLTTAILLKTGYRGHRHKHSLQEPFIKAEYILQGVSDKASDIRDCVVGSLRQAEHHE